MADIQFRPEEMRAVALDGEKVIGECKVSASGRLWLLTHTEVDPAYGGQGIAGKLVDCVVEAAALENVRNTLSFLISANGPSSTNVWLFAHPNSGADNRTGSAISLHGSSGSTSDIYSHAPRSLGTNSLCDQHT